MATHNVGGHAVTDVLAGTDHTKAIAKQPAFQGPVSMNGAQAPSHYKNPKGGGSFPPKAAGSTPKQSGPYNGPMAVS
jgi:hypothetical protein